jgi:hypothetical protein
MPEAMKALRITAPIINKNGRSKRETGLSFANFGQNEPRNIGGLNLGEPGEELILEAFLEIGQNLIHHRQMKWRAPKRLPFRLLGVVEG